MIYPAAFVCKTFHPHTLMPTPILPPGWPFGSEPWRSGSVGVFSCLYAGPGFVPAVISGRSACRYGSVGR